MAAAAGTSRDMVLLIVTRNKHRAARRRTHHSHRRPAFDDGALVRVEPSAACTKRSRGGMLLLKPIAQKKLCVCVCVCKRNSTLERVLLGKMVEATGFYEGAK
jgi:hypothetical protein